MAGREAQFLLYRTDDGRTRVEVRFEGETAWLPLGQMAALFQRDKSVISRHVTNIFEEGELRPEATAAKSATAQREGGREVTRLGAACEHHGRELLRHSRGLWVRLHYNGLSLAMPELWR